jgi:hypothetical protein
MSIGINLMSLGQHNVVESDRCDSGRVVGNPYLGITSRLPVIQEQSGNHIPPADLPGLGRVAECRYRGSLSSLNKTVVTL